MNRKGCAVGYIWGAMGVTLLAIIGAPRDVIAEPEVREYCEANTFHGRCAEDEVIIMDSARYGRMRRGECLENDYGQQSCSSDILRAFDLWCSGRPSCDVEVRDLLTKVPQPCPKDLRNYLEAGYSCVKVVWPTVQQCVSSNPMVTMDTGFLSNYVTEKTSCGNIDLPWTIRVPKGQQINLTLYDFAFSPSGNDQPNICQVLAVVKDKGEGATTATKTVCNGMRRMEHVMMSQTNEVEVRFVLKSKPNDDGRYHILKFEALGCADPVQANMWFKRTRTTARVGCGEVSGRTWQLHCEGTKWKGTMPDCAAAVDQLPNVMENSSLSPVPYGVSVAIILAIALLIGVLILTIGLVIIRRRRNRVPQSVTHPDPNKMSKDDCYIERIPYTDQGQGQGQGHSYHPDSAYNPVNGENAYYRTWELQRHMSHGGGTMIHPGHACSASVPPGYQGTRMREDSPPRYMEHIYESPKSVRREIEAMGSDSLKYYELDPNVTEPRKGKEQDVPS